MKYFAGIEAGGTKFVCALGDSRGKILQEITLPTETPEITLKKIIEFFKKVSVQYPVHAFGIGSFGPIDAHLLSPTYGYITSTPKAAWQNYNIVGHIQKEFPSLPIGFATDVGTAALGEYVFGEGQGIRHVMYMTVGTGIGAASIVDGHLLPGVSHQEIGHILIPQDLKLDSFAGVCPYHHNCLEGLASGSAMKKRWQVESALHLPAHHPAWELEADYLAAALTNCILTLSPERIILGGGVMRQAHLFTKIRHKVAQKISAYVHLPNLENYIVAPGLADRAGVIGAIALAQKTAQEESV